MNSHGFALFFPPIEEAVSAEFVSQHIYSRHRPPEGLGEVRAGIPGKRQTEEQQRPCWRILLSKKLDFIHVY